MEEISERRERVQAEEIFRRSIRFEQAEVAKSSYSKGLSADAVRWFMTVQILPLCTWICSSSVARQTNVELDRGAEAANQRREAETWCANAALLVRLIDYLADDKPGSVVLVGAAVALRSDKSLGVIDDRFRRVAIGRAEMAQARYYKAMPRESYTAALQIASRLTCDVHGQVDGDLPRATCRIVA